MLNEYKNKIELQKEVLSSLPRNNNKNNKSYQAKIEELLGEYQIDKEVVEEEITKRKNRYLSLEDDKNIDNLTKKIDLLLPQLPILNKYNSSYEKSNLDIILYELGHFYKTDLDKVNKDINEALDIFKKVGVPLVVEDFSYSYHSSNYMKKYLSSEEKEELKKDFEDIYWKCPDIITHITLNFKYLYCKNKKKFDTYYDTLEEDLSNKKVLEEYKELYINRSTLIRNNAYLMQKNLLEGKLNISDYTLDKVNKAYSYLLEDHRTEKTNNDIEKLYYSIIEYKNYLEFDYIISDIKELYKDKDKYKNIYSSKKKEIDKIERIILKNNKKILKLVAKNKINKIDVLNSKVNIDINKLKILYEELERNYFLEKIATLEEDTTIYDILLLVDSNYNYLIELLKNKEKDIQEIEKLRLFVYNPYNYILNNILLSEEKDISILIMDRYNLFGFDLTKEKLEKDNIDNLIKQLEVILNSIVMNKNNITESRIRFLKDTSL